MTANSTQKREVARRERSEARRLKRLAKRAAKRVGRGPGIERGVLHHAMQLLQRAKRREARAGGRELERQEKAAADATA